LHSTALGVLAPNSALHTYIICACVEEEQADD
jgi:hypothetical protein